MKNFKIIKLDKRFKGNGHFKYGATTNFEHIFCEMREWCWTTFGPSKEIGYWLDDTDFRIHYMPKPKTVVHHNEHWSWHSDDLSFNKIFLRSEKELVLFKLRFE